MSQKSLELSPNEHRSYEAALIAHSKQPCEFRATVAAYDADLGPRVRIVTIASPAVEGKYSAGESSSWIEQFRADLANGLYSSS